MIIRNLLNNETATAGGELRVQGIGAGIYRPIRLEQADSVTSITLIYSRNGAQKATATVTPYEGAILDMSMMAAATPSITESINAGLGLTDFVDSMSLLYMEGTLKSIMIRVIHAPIADGRFTSQASTRNLSDYGNGLFNRPDFSNTPFLNSPLTGKPFNFALRYGRGTMAEAPQYGRTVSMPLQARTSHITSSEPQTTRLPGDGRVLSVNTHIAPTPTNA